MRRFFKYVGHNGILFYYFKINFIIPNVIGFDGLNNKFFPCFHKKKMAIETEVEILMDM